MQVLLNHASASCPPPPRSRRCSTSQPPAAQPFSVVDLRTRAVVHAGLTAPTAPVGGWRDRHFAQADLTAVTTPGRYAV